MADHYSTSVDLLAQVEQHRKDLDVLHSASRVVGGRTPAAHVVAAKYDAIRTSLQLAKIHAQLAEVQALHDLRAVVESGDRSVLTSAL